MGAVLLAAGTKGKRYALPNARIMIHQPWVGAGRCIRHQHSGERILRMKDRLNEILALHTANSRVACQGHRPGLFHVAAEARDYGWWTRL